MLTAILDCPRIDLFVDRKPLTPEQEKRFALMQQRRAQGEPLQYIIGHCDFMGLKIFVDERVLIPRHETEILVDVVIQEIKALNLTHPRILDLGTGSGNIAITLSKHFFNAHVTAVDCSKDALKVARMNAAYHQVDYKISFLQADIKEILLFFIKDKFDIIISNPPYIATSAMAHLPIDVKREPRLALDGGTDGLEFYRIIIEHSHKHLKENGLIFFEVGDDQSKNVKELLTHNGNYENIGSAKDYRDVHRIIFAKKK